MSGIRFVGYQETQGQHQEGIATVEFTTRIFLPNSREERTFVFNVNYKIVAKKDNTGFFPAIASYKIAVEGPGNYKDCFELDSNSMKREIEQLIMEGFKNHYGKPRQNLQNQSVFNHHHSGSVSPAKGYENATQVKSDAFVEEQLPF